MLRFVVKCDDTGGYRSGHLGTSKLRTRRLRKGKDRIKDYKCKYRVAVLPQLGNDPCTVEFPVIPKRPPDSNFVNTVGIRESHFRRIQIRRLSAVV